MTSPRSKTTTSSGHHLSVDFTTSIHKDARRTLTLFSTPSPRKNYRGTETSSHPRNPNRARFRSRQPMRPLIHKKSPQHYSSTSLPLAPPTPLISKPSHSRKAPKPNHLKTSTPSPPRPRPMRISRASKRNHLHLHPSNPPINPKSQSPEPDLLPQESPNHSSPPLVIDSIPWEWNHTLPH